MNAHSSEPGILLSREVRDASADIIYGLDDSPPPVESLFAALQHLLAIFIPIITPALIICGALELDVQSTSYIVSMSLFISGVATFIQIRKIGPLGSGLLSIQGTSFTFLGAIISAGSIGGLPEIFGACIIGSFIEMIVSRFIPLVRKIIPPLVTGIIVTLIGLTLIKAGINNCAGGSAALADGTYAHLQHIGLAFLVLAVIILCNRSSNKYVRMSSVVIGLVAGYAAAAFQGLISFNRLSDLSYVAMPVPLKFGFGFSISTFIPVALIYFVTTIESIGDITATSLVSKQPITGNLYVKRISGGVLADGFNSLLAGLFSTFPNTTFSQNNGIIQLTGVASRTVGYYVAGMLVFLGLCPFVAGIFTVMPAPVLGGATLLMFGTVAAAGLKIIAATYIDRRAILIIAVSLSLGLGVTLEPHLLHTFPDMLQHIFQSGIVTGGLAAITCNLILPIPAKRRTDNR